MTTLRLLYEQTTKYNKATEASNAKISTLKPCRITASKTPWHVSLMSDHAASQAHIRFPNKTSSEWEDFHRKAIKSIEKEHPVDGVHVIHSASHGHGVVASVDNKRKSYKLITVLGNNQNNATTKSDIKHICETMNIDVEYDI